MLSAGRYNPSTHSLRKKERKTRQQQNPPKSCIPVQDHRLGTITCFSTDWQKPDGVEYFPPPDRVPDHLLPQMTDAGIEMFSLRSPQVKMLCRRSVCYALIATADSPKHVHQAAWLSLGQLLFVWRKKHMFHSPSATPARKKTCVKSSSSSSSSIP